MDPRICEITSVLNAMRSLMVFLMKSLGLDLGGKCPKDVTSG